MIIYRFIGYFIKYVKIFIVEKLKIIFIIVIRFFKKIEKDAIIRSFLSLSKNDCITQLNKKDEGYFEKHI